MSDYIGVVTNAGQVKIAAAIGGTALNLTTIRVGDGNGAPITPNPAMTDLVRRVGNAYPIIGAGPDPVSPNHWRVSVLIPGEDGPFDIREIGVFDSAGTMIAIARHVLVEKRSPAQGAAVELVADIVFPVSETAQVTVQLQPSAAISIFQMLRAGFTVVESATVTAPPGAPALGRTHVIPAGATGAWAGLAGYLAQWNGAVWVTVNVPDGFLVVAGDVAVDAANRYLRKTAGGWVSGAASSAAYGVTRLATPAEAKARTATDVALTPAGLDNAASDLAGRQPIYPEVLTGANALTATASAGQIVIDPAQNWQHRGLISFSSDSFSAPDRTFATVASKTYHLVWDAPGTGLAVPLATYPAGRFSLIDRTAASPVETDRSYDSGYDRMLCQRVVTNGANVPTVTPLKNKADLHATLEFASYYTQTSGFGGLTYQSITLNWARTPQLQFAKIDLDVTLGTEGLMQFNAPCTRYGGSSWAFGYALVSSVNTYISGYHIVEARA